jgi:hypothetical protein
MNKLTFAGHETFQCRNFWLKKGYDFIKSDKTFSNDEAILELGVGKNMVMSINFWLKAFQIIDSTDKPSEIADKIFGDKGFDPYLENEGTLWLLQHLLIKTNLASIYSLVFNDFRKSRIASQYTTNQLLKYLQKETQKAGINVAETTLRNDIKVFTKTYLAESKHGKGMEDDLSSILIELNLISKVEDRKLEEGTVYHINVTERKEIPTAIMFFCLLDSFPTEESISFDRIQEKLADSFACNAEGLESHIESICEKYNVVYKENAGRKEVQVKGAPNKWEILKKYYNG